jgi:hypothetical protein
MRVWVWEINLRVRGWKLCMVGFTADYNEIRWWLTYEGWGPACLNMILGGGS